MWKITSNFACELIVISAAQDIVWTNIAYLRNYLFSALHRGNRKILHVIVDLSLVDIEKNVLVDSLANAARTNEPVPLSTTVFDAHAVIKQKL